MFSGVADLTELRKVKGLALRDPEAVSANETYHRSKRDLSASAPGLLCVCVEERAEELSPLRHPPPTAANLRLPHLRLLFFRLQDGMAEEGACRLRAYRLHLPPVNLSGKSRMAVRLAWRGDVVYVSVSKQTCPGAKDAYPGAKETCTAAGQHAEHCCLAVHVPTGRQLQLPSAANMCAKEHILGSLQGSDNCDGGWAACVGEWHGGGARRLRCAPYSLILLPVLAAAPPAAAQPLGEEEEEVVVEDEEEEGVGAALRGRLAYEVRVYMPPAVSDKGLVQVVQMASEEEGPAVRRPPDGGPAHPLSSAALGARQDWHPAVGECAEWGGLMMVRGRECLVVYPSKCERTDFHERLQRTRKSSAVCLRMRPLVCQCQ